MTLKSDMVRMAQSEYALYLIQPIDYNFDAFHNDCQSLGDETVKYL